MYYLATDLLGSITAIVPAVGNNIEYRSYDAWGRPRNPDDWTYNNVSAFSLIDRGYTFHEHLPEFGLINMNGRMCDPLVARFLSPDPYVQDPGSTQGFNRYSYCLNNPLKYNDPDGEFWHIIIGAVVGGAINLAANWDNCEGFWQYVAAFGIGAGTGAAAAATGGASAWAQLGVAAGGAALTASTNSVIAQTDKNFSGMDQVDWGIVGRDASIGAAAGIVSFGAAKATSSLLKGDLVFGNVRLDNKTVWAQGIKQGLSGGAGGYAGGFASGYLYTGDVEAAHKYGVSGAYLGGGIGFASGFGGAYVQAKRGGYSAWTGRANVTAKAPQLKYDTGQIGKKYGEHWGDYPGMNHSDYLDLAKSIYSDPISTKIVFPLDAVKYPGETHYYNNGNLLRIAPDGSFRSLYPIK